MDWSIFSGHQGSTRRTRQGQGKVLRHNLKMSRVRQRATAGLLFFAYADRTWFQVHHKGLLQFLRVPPAMSYTYLRRGTAMLHLGVFVGRRPVMSPFRDAQTMSSWRFIGADLPLSFRLLLFPQTQHLNASRQNGPSCSLRYACLRQSQMSIRCVDRWSPLLSA